MADTDEPAPRLTHTVLIPGDGGVVVALEGELDLATAEELDAAVQQSLPAVGTRLVLDLTGLRFADSSGITLWVNWSRQVPAIEIRNARPMIQRVIDAMGLGTVLNPS